MKRPESLLGVESAKPTRDRPRWCMPFLGFFVALWMISTTVCLGILVSGVTQCKGNTVTAWEYLNPFKQQTHIDGNREETSSGSAASELLLVIMKDHASEV